MTTEPKQYAII